MNLFSIFFLLSFNLWAQEDLSFKDDKLSLAQLKSSYAHLSPEEFSLKLAGSLESPLLFFRSFVNTFYQELSLQKNSSIKGTCFGDAHPENFGFILFNDKTRFVFNDLDDSGECWVEFDLLRYFTALSLTFNRPELVDLTLRHFLEVLQDPARASQIDPQLIPSLEKKNKKLLDKYTSGDTFGDHPELLSVTDLEKKQLVLEAQASGLFDKIKILDLAKVQRDTGGSGGLERFWLLVQNAQNKYDILELKEMAPSALTFLQSQSYRSPEQRLSSLKNDLWGETPLFYNTLRLKSGSYLVRSRTKDDVNLKKLKELELKSYLKAQVSILGLHHGKNKKINREKLGSWLSRSVAITHHRYHETYKFLLKQKN